MCYETDDWSSLNPFAPEPPVRIYLLSTAFDVISFNGQGQRCPLTCAEWRGLSNQNEHNSVKETEQKAKNHVTLTWKFPGKSCYTTHLPFLSSDPKIIKAFLKTFPTKMKPNKCLAREKKWGKKSDKRGVARKRKVKVKTAVSLLNPKTWSPNFAFCACPNFAS